MTEGKMIVYYDITVWEQVDVGDYETLKKRHEDFAKALNNFGFLSYKIRTESDEAQAGGEIPTDEPTE